ncbi:Sensor protein ZraS [Anatilimnocola aggregata]|uniref:histidine kinase n=1 Tax=Anatilimnocola aggregata TaxID=2528021 RepID=A0A517YDN0_9BACT|nr:ATP-binding protein [Anatilimnocola aggregata]QDU28343.1 Sensor protein ZraS [Anatilimnocola aggregata]
MMKRIELMKFMAPLVGMSVLLAVLGGTSAWYVQRQQVTASDSIAREVHGLVAIHNLYIVIREVRYQLNQYLRFSDDGRLDEIAGLDGQVVQMLKESQQLSDKPMQRAQLQKVAEGYQLFAQELAAARKLPADGRHAILDKWANTQINELILNPAQQCVLLNEKIVTSTNEVNRRTSNQLTQVFLFLGIAGSVAGVLMGLTIARRLQRSLQELHGFVAGAAGRLEGLSEPFPAPPTGELIELRLGAKSLERRAIQVVEQLQQREIEVLRNEQLAAVGQLAAGLAHELRNPLMPMKMLVQAALSGPANSGLQGRQLQILEEEISRMETSIQSFLDFARPPSIDKRRTDLRPIVEQTIELISGRAAEQNIAIECEVPKIPCELELDPTQIKQVLLNLLLNAMDELGSHGKIRVSVELGTPYVEVNDGDGPVATAAGVRLVIADNGPGIAPDLLDKIFDPFVSHKESGTGLGLTICRRIVAGHGGQIVAANCPERGAEFRIWLPA